MTNEEIGTRLRDLRESKNLTQEDMAWMLSVDRQTVYRYENGETEPKISTLAKYAKALGVPADFILFGNDSDLISKKSLFDFIDKNGIVP